MDTENSSNAPVRIEKDSPESDDRYSVISAEEGKEMKPPKNASPGSEYFLLLLLCICFMISRCGSRLAKPRLKHRWR